MIEISVIIPTYNREKLIGGVLESLAEQTLPQGLYEVIVVDDGSVDNTRVVVEAFKSKIKNIKYLSREHGGLPSARNFGIGHTRGNVIAFTDSDCVAEPHWLREILKGFKDLNIVGIAGRVVTDLHIVTPFTHQVNVGSGDAAGCNMAFRRSALIELGGFDEDYYFFCEDTDFFLRAQECGKVVYNGNAIVHHPPVRQTLIQFIGRIGPICEGQFLLCKRHPSVFLHRKPLLAVIRVVGLKMFWEDLRKNKYFIRRNPFLYLVYFLALVCQRVYLAYFLFANYDRVNRINSTRRRQRGKD